MPRVSVEVLVDQESLADREHQACQGRRVRQVGTESQAQLESKESPVSQEDSPDTIPLFQISICLADVVYSALFTIASLLIQFSLQDFLVMVVPVQLDFQGCQVNNHPVYVTVLFVMIIDSAPIQPLLYLSILLKVQRETQAFPVRLALLVSPGLKERVVSPAHLVLRATAALLGLQDWLCRALKDS